MLGPGAPTGPGVVGGGKVSAALMVGRSVNARRHDVRKLVKVRAFFVPIKENTRTLFPTCEDVFGLFPGQGLDPRTAHLRKQAQDFPKSP